MSKKACECERCQMQYSVEVGTFVCQICGYEFTDDDRQNLFKLAREKGIRKSHLKEKANVAKGVSDERNTVTS